MRKLYLAVTVTGAACSLLGILGWEFFPAEMARPKQSSSPEAGTQRLDIGRPVYVREGAVACEDPKDFDALELNAEAFTSLDQGDFFQSCLEWSKQRVRILRYRGNLVEVVKADAADPAGRDAWVLNSSLQN